MPDKIRRLSLRDIVKAAPALVSCVALLTGCSLADRSKVSATNTSISVPIAVATETPAVSEPTMVDVKEKGLPYTVEEVVQNVKEGKWDISVFSVGFRTDSVTTFYGKEIEDLLSPGTKKSILWNYSYGPINKENEMPRWIFADGFSRIVTVIEEKGEGGKNQRFFVGYREGGNADTLYNFNCIDGIGCDTRIVHEFLGREFQAMKKYTQDKAYLNPN